VFGDLSGGGTQTNVLLGSTNRSVSSLTFSGSTSSYSFSGTSLPVLTLNGDITTTAANPNPVVFDSSIAVALTSGAHTIDLAEGLPSMQAQISAALARASTRLVPAH